MRAFCTRSPDHLIIPLHAAKEAHRDGWIPMHRALALQPCCDTYLVLKIEAKMCRKGGAYHLELLYDTNSTDVHLHLIIDTVYAAGRPRSPVTAFGPQMFW